MKRFYPQAKNKKSKSHRGCRDSFATKRFNSKLNLRSKFNLVKNLKLRTKSSKNFKMITRQARDEKRKCILHTLSFEDPKTKITIQPKNTKLTFIFLAKNCQKISAVYSYDFIF